MESDRYEGRESGGDGNREVLAGWVLFGNGEQRAVAHLGRRLVARLLDTLILILILVMIFTIFEIPIEDFGHALGWIRDMHSGDLVHDPENPFSGLAHVIVFLIIAFVYLVALFYDMLFTAALGYTPGKRIMTIRIVRMEDGSKPRFWKGLTRALVLHSPWGWLFALTFGSLSALMGTAAFLVIVYLAPVWNKQRRGWHDKTSGTVVVKAA